MNVSDYKGIQVAVWHGCMRQPQALTQGGTKRQQHTQGITVWLWWHHQKPNSKSSNWLLLPGCKTLRSGTSCWPDHKAAVQHALGEGADTRKQSIFTSLGHGSHLYIAEGRWTLQWAGQYALV